MEEKKLIQLLGLKKSIVTLESGTENGHCNYLMFETSEGIQWQVNEKNGQYIFTRYN